ncbi:MAG: heat-shock protein Hsp20 [Porticoccaceae bacterium]|nr:MAG: heat-shock protein Hsp20 [Porticoccaceae bacterium]
MSETRPVQSPGTALTAGAETELVLRPPVDIWEDAEQITLVADLPGVAKERLNIQLDGDALTIEGQVALDTPEGMEALYADVRATRYRRAFTLSGELDAERIEAELRNGVLKVRIPKRAELQPRRIEVKGS